MASKQNLTFLVSNEFTDVELNRVSGPSPQKDKSKRKIRERRRKHARGERLRTNALNKAFKSLFECIPDYFQAYYMWKKGKEGGNVSKRDILQMATRYIEFLDDIFCQHVNEDGIVGTLSAMNTELSTF